jgi:hypothetical protein
MFTTSEAYELYDETEYVLNELYNTRKIKLGVISNLDERVGKVKYLQPNYSMLLLYICVC